MNRGLAALATAGALFAVYGKLVHPSLRTIQIKRVAEQTHPARFGGAERVAAVS